MNILGIESTAHTLGLGVVTDKGEILADARSMYRPKTGGILPREAAEHHMEVAHRLFEEIEAIVPLADIDAFAFSQGPGLGPCLRVGAVLARYLALTRKKPLYAVNHPVAHIEIGNLATGAKDPVVLYVSGGNTQVIAHTGGRYRVFGETLDIPIGNCLDQFARELGIPHPGGPEIEKIAKKGKNYVPLPYTVKGMDMSFSGVLTEGKRQLTKHSKEDLCFSLQETAFAMLVEVTERAMAHTEKEEVLLVGGVAANQRFAEMISKMAGERGAEVKVVPMKLAADNGVMIAWVGALMHNAGVKQKLANTTIDQRQRVDQIPIVWR